MVWIKVCGVTSEQDAELVVESGADAIGLNFVPTSKRRVSLSAAAAIAARVAGRAELVAVLADPTDEELAELLAAVPLASLQLHGSETPERLLELDGKPLPAFKAIRVAGPADVAEAHAYGGSRLLVDAKVDGHLGGSGVAFEWSLVEALAARRQVILAGGLSPENAALAVARLRPYGLDVASGVEPPAAPNGQKDRDRVLRFVANARRAASLLPPPPA